MRTGTWVRSRCDRRRRDLPLRVGPVPGDLHVLPLRVGLVPGDLHVLPLRVGPVPGDLHVHLDLHLHEGACVVFVEVEVEVTGAGPAPRHRCQRCGASCQGLKVRVGDGERDALQDRARLLGIDRPFSGPYLRQNWGTCVFYADGCRLHATFGADAKPSVCRRFPEVDGIDPACFHPGPVDAGAPWPAWDDLTIGSSLAARLRALPFEAVRKPRLLGSITADALEGLERAEPVVPGADAGYLRWAATAAAPSVAHHPDARALLVGGGQLLVGLERSHLYAAWIRLLRQVAAL